ncbi:MAG: cobyrinate a,c-diamide synthase [Phycisphaerae bacterium]|nr:cobyrinate a,c-diamide synthase [Phycisphaerae bacterium]
MTGGPGKMVIAGTSSGVGKTSLTLGLARALTRHGLRVQTFKVGPDFLDPTYLSPASGRTCYNLDGWMTGRDYVRDLFARTTADADIALVEGVMGLFDGASPDALDGSTAQIAAWLDAPVLLVANAHGAARSLAATVHGFASFEPGVRIAGVIANQSGSERHEKWIEEALAAAKLPPLLGAVPRGAMPELKSRHLGLVSADGDILPDETIDRLADACEKHLDIEQILRVAHPLVPSCSEPALGARRPAPGASIRLGVARDAAFHFYYPDNLQMLAAAGAELVFFSPLNDRGLPGGLDAIYLGGGYPEVHADQLSANKPMLADIRAFSASGKRIYAECGGLIYLGRGVRTLDDKTVPLAGVLPIDTAMLERLKTLGYVEATLAGDGLLGQAGAALRGHEFHYSEIIADDAAAAGWAPAYSLRRRRDDASRPEGFCGNGGRVLASYVHLHLGSDPGSASRFCEQCEAKS